VVSVSIVIALFALAEMPPPPPILPYPSAAQLAGSLAQWREKPTPMPVVRNVRCSDIREEPTEFMCRFEERVGGRWLRKTGILARSSGRWKFLDDPEILGTKRN
jgi:hypothetical protein